jgi:hypothetical protein
MPEGFRPGIEQIRNTKIDQTPSHEADFDRSKENLEKSLEKTTHEDIKQVREYAKNHLTKEQAIQVNEILQEILNLQTFEKNEAKQRALNKLAQKKIYKLTDVEQLHLKNKQVEETIKQLNSTCYALAQAEFPEQLKVQEKFREEDQQDALQKRKEELEKINVS